MFALLFPLAWLVERLGAPAGTAYVVAAAVSLWQRPVGAIVARPRLRTRVVPIAGLPTALDGYRIGQLSDVHCGPHTPATRVRRWVERLNALDLDLMTVTGDLITHGSSHVADVAAALGGLRARDGVYACMGNHDYFTDGEDFVRALTRAGPRRPAQPRRGRRARAARASTSPASTTPGPRATTSRARSPIAPRARPRSCWRTIPTSSPRRARATSS